MLLRSFLLDIIHDYKIDKVKCFQKSAFFEIRQILSEIMILLKFHHSKGWASLQPSIQPASSHLGYSRTNEGLFFNRKGFEFRAPGSRLFKSACEETSSPGHWPSNSWPDHAQASNPVENPHIYQTTTSNDKQQRKQPTTDHNNQIWG